MRLTTSQLASLGVAAALIFVAISLSCSRQENPPSNTSTAGLPSTRPAASPATRPSGGSGGSGGWATALTRPGLPNLHKVNDHLYRGAQPTADGYPELKKLGIKTVINLRSMHSDLQECQQAGLAYIQIPMDTWHPESDDVLAFLRAASDGANQPVFVHCQHGADRTGTCLAVYRIVVDGWSKDDAIAEMTEGGFGFHPLWQNLIQYVRQVDQTKLQQAMTKER